VLAYVQAAHEHCAHGVGIDVLQLQHMCWHVACNGTGYAAAGTEILTAR
jgi:hypothetical protein